MTTIRRYASRRPVHLLLMFIAATIVVFGRGSGHLGILLAQVNPIPAENLLAGTPQTEWDVFGNGDPAIQGFAADMSVNVGTTVDFKVDVNVATPFFHLDIYRIGYYQGNGARLVTTIANMPRTPQPGCVPDGATGLVDCGNWTVSASWAVPADAVSGVYIAKAVRDGTHNFAETEGASHIVFIVRDDSRPVDVLLQTSDTTWQAYNRYGGASLYCGGPISNVGSAYLNSCPGRAAKVSYNRPIDTRGHSPQSFFFSADYPMIRFLEANGYNVKYWSGVDTDRSGVALTTGAGKPRAFISVGHDEYWSGNQRTAVENARAAGVNLAFFSGNEVYWKTRWEPSIAGTPTNHRTLVSYKDTLAGVKLDPLPNVTTGTWRDTRFGPPNDGGRPENALVGPIWTVNSGTAAITVPASMAGLRLWRGTRVADLTTGSATLAPGTLGYEWGEDLDNGFRPNGLFHLSSTTVNNVEKVLDFGATVGMGTATHHLTLYRHNSGALVFGASTVQWAWGLDREHDDNGMSPHSHSPDQAMQQATVNLLAEMGAQPGSLQNGVDPNRIDPNRVLTPGSASTDLMAPTTVISSPSNGAQVESGSRITISGTALENGGGTVAAVEVSVDAGATWKRAVGTTTWSYEWSPGAVGPATIRSRGIDDSGNLESAATGGVTVQVIVGECPCTSLWKPSTIPANPSASDSGAYELGVKFQSDINGFITGIRFYKGSANTGTHVGNLWTSAGTLMATATFTNESATGWQQVNFGTPVAITANTTYVASYHTPNGGYAFDPAYFTTTRDAPPLHAPASATSGGNGVFSPGGVAFPNQTFNANNYWVDVVFAQSLDDVTPPVITAIKATAIDSARATVSWTTNEQTSTRLDYGTDPAILTATLQSLPPGTLTVTNSSFVAQHALSLAGLQANTTYYYLVTAIDHAGNTTTVAAPTFTVPGPTLRDTASTDFAAGTTSGTYVSQTADGEVILAPATGAEFNGPALPQGWIETPWTSEGYSQIVNGVLLVDGARVATCATDVNGACVPGETTTSTPSAIYTAPHSLEFSANFSGDSFQHAGFAVTFGSASEPWAIFSTLSGGLLFARTNTGNGAIDTPIGPGPLGEFHRYRIDWKPTSVDYYIDGALVVSHALTVAGPMRPVAASDFNPFGGIVFVDWMRLSPMATPGTFVSRVFDANNEVNWNSIQWKARTPAGTSVGLSVRAGNVLALDGSVQGAWTPVAGPGPLTNLASRYIQYRAVMATADPAGTPELEDIIVSTGHAPVAMPDSAAVAKNGIYTFPPSGVGSLIANDTDADVTDILDVVAVTTPSHGTAVLNADGSVNYTPTANYFGPDAFTYTVSDGLLSGSATVTINVHDGNMPPVANNDFFTVSEDTPLVVPAPGLLANDTDVENNPLTAVLVSFPLHGMLTLGANGAFTYTPALNYAGPDAFSYRANDGTSSGTIATVNLLVNQANDPPFTEPDSFNAMLNIPLDVLAPGVLANDHDVEVEDTAPMHTELVSTVSHGTLTLNSDGSFSYVPNADFLGTDSFSYKAVDHFNAASTLPKTVTITVAIKAVTQTVVSGTVSTGTGVSASDPLNTAITTPTAATVAIAQGVISGSASPTGYTFLNQQVNITVTDPAGAEVTATTANPLVFSFEIDLSLIPAGQTAQTFEIFRNNVRVPNCYVDPLLPPLTFIPAANLDPCVSARSNGTKVKLTVLTTHASHWNMGMGTPPDTDNLFATNDPSYATNYQTPLHVATNKGVTMNDLGPGSLSVVPTGTPYGGTVVLDPSGAFEFTPNAGFCGLATFTYELHADSTVIPAVPAVDTAIATIKVNCIPIAATDVPPPVLEDSGPTMIDVRFNDSDPDQPVSPKLAITAVTQGANGTVAIGGTVATPAGGAWVSYQPNPNFFGTDSFTYTIQDISGDTATGTVNMTVTPVNDVPSFVKGANDTVMVNSGAQTRNGWATAILAGPVNENTQTLTFTVTNSNNALFSAPPALASNGTLTYTSAANASGSATVTVVLQDDGGTANGGVNTSAAQTFTITVVQGTTSTSVSSSSLTSLFKVPVTFTAAVASIPAGNLSGNVVTFKDGTATLGTGMLNAAGVATFTTSTLAVGTHSITAVFAGTSAYLGSTSPTIAQVIQPSATLKVNFQAHALMDGTNKPKIQVVPVAGAVVRVYKRWDTCTSDLYVSAQPRKWGLVFDGADGPGGVDGCSVLSIGSYRAEGITDANGNVDIIVPPTTTKPNIDYLVIGRSLDFNATTTPTEGDAIYAGYLKPSISADDVKKIPLHEIRLFSGKRVAGRSLEEFGSYLDMVQPEEMEWTEDETLYPVILVAEGDWAVTTSIATPSGFVPEESALSTAVANTTSAVQFSIVDVGSEWTPTTLTHVVKHNGTTRIQKLAVPMINRKRTKAKPDYFTVDPGSSGNVLDVLVNDNVAPPKTLTITAITQGANGGSVSIAADGKSIVYTPPTATYVGRDSFTYTVDDGVGVVSTGTANIRVNTKPSLVIGDISVPEGNLGATTALFTVTLSSPSENEISFDYATVDSTAVAGIDYSFSSGTATLAPGQTSKTISVQIIGNTVYQTNRKFTMKLWLDAANKTNAVVFGGAANGTIVDDDPKPSIATTDVTVIEGNAGMTTAVVTVTLTGETALPASVNYLTGNGTAGAGSDYVAAAGTLTFAPGETSTTVTLAVVGDTVAEATETFVLSLTTADQASLAINKARVTVVDDDATSWISTTVADFKDGTVDAGAYISKTNNGEVILAPALGTEFLEPELPAGWTSTPLGAGGTTTIGNKVVSIDGAALVGGAAGYAQGRSLEFSATFAGIAGQYGGFSSTGAVQPPFAMFGTKVNGTLLARSVNGSTTLETELAKNLLNASQKFRIDWNGSTIVYWVNDKKVATHTITISTPMRPALIDSAVGSGVVDVSWVRMTPYAASGNYTSTVFDAGGMVTWLSAAWATTVPAGTTAVFKYRVGNSPTPDATWTSFTTVAASGGALSGTSRYFQFMVQESTTDSRQTPVVKDVTLAFKR